MPVREQWSPTRIKDALQCGRRLQGREEHWPKVENIKGVRGSAVHKAIEQWEASDRMADTPELIVEAWRARIAETMDGFDPSGIFDMLLALWRVEGEIDLVHDLVAAELADRYKQPRRTKDFAAKTAHLEPVRNEAASQRADITEMVDDVDWPWETTKGVLVEGFDHSLHTVNLGRGYLTELWPNPDIVGAEWELTAELGNGYRVRGFIDRVEASDGILQVVDYKSSEWQESILDHWLQAATYAVIAEDHMGTPPDQVQIVYLRDRKRAVFEVQPYWRDRLAELVVAADRVLESKAFAPTFAGCGICGFYPICTKEFGLIPIESAKEEVA